jgi:hypothetical protein
MPNATITLDDAEQMQLEEILMDRDEKGALDFLQRVVKHKLDQRLKSGCKPEFEGPTTMPFQR